MLTAVSRPPSLRAGSLPGVLSGAGRFGGYSHRVVDPRSERMAAAVAALERPLRWAARVATLGSVLGAACGGLLWWELAGHHATSWWRGSLGAALVLGLLLAPAAWLTNVRFALVSLIGLPTTVHDIARRRGAQLRHPRVGRPRGGTVAAMRSIRAVVSDYGEVVGSWAVVTQLASPVFWALTVAALVAVAALAFLAAALVVLRLLF